MFNSIRAFSVLLFPAICVVLFAGSGELLAAQEARAAKKYSYAHLYNSAADCACQMGAMRAATIEEKEEIKQLVVLKLCQYKTEDEKCVVLNYWLDTMLAGGHIEQAKILLNCGADPNALIAVIHDEKGTGRLGGYTTLLMDAASCGYVPSVEFLLRHGADPLLYNCNGHSALHSAVLGKREANACAVIRLLKEKMPIDCAIDYPTDEPLPYKAGCGFVSGKTPLWMALEKKRPVPELIARLLKWGARPNEQHPESKERPLDYVLKVMRPAHAPEKTKLHDIAKTLYCYGAQSNLLTAAEKAEFEQAQQNFFINDEYLPDEFDLLGPQEDNEKYDQAECVIL